MPRQPVRLPEQRKPGRKPKGERTPATVRVPERHYNRYLKLADEAGLSLNDYLVRELALRHQLDLPDYLQPPQKENLGIAI